MSLIGFFFHKGPKWRARAEAAQDETTAAQVDALEAKADLEKEKIKHETQQALDDLADTSDDELVASIIAEHRRRNGKGSDVEGPGADD